MTLGPSMMRIESRAQTSVFDIPPPPQRPDEKRSGDGGHYGDGPEMKCHDGSKRPRSGRAARRFWDDRRLNRGQDEPVEDRNDAKNREANEHSPGIERAKFSLHEGDAGATNIYVMQERPPIF